MVLLTLLCFSSVLPFFGLIPSIHLKLVAKPSSSINKMVTILGILSRGDPKSLTWGPT
jgi:hypothetical protein